MKKKNLARIGASVLTMAMVIQSVSTASFALENNHQIVRTNSQIQMSSEPEIVYANVYSNPSIRSQDFNSNWKFNFGDASGAESVEFNDSKWQHISVPHDYSITQKFSENMEAESGYLPGGLGWYRKHFTVSKDMLGKRLRLDFDGVYMNATVYINGHKLGTHPFGYTPFSFDITKYVKVGQDNVVAVKVDHKTPSSRWYSGSGIYRNVHLSVMDEVHVGLYGTKIETPSLKDDYSKDKNVTTKVATTISNDGETDANVVLTHSIFKKDEDASKNIGTVTTSSQIVKAGQSKNIDATVQAISPKLWNLENPALYTVRTEVKVDNRIVDTYDTDYGFRWFEMDKNKGASLNGKKLKLKGVCMHHDQGSLGSAAYHRAIERQVEILQEMGCNSIRVTHNPASTDLIKICNEKGILVIDELFDGWMHSKNDNTHDYAEWFNKNIESSNQIVGKNKDMTWAEFDLKAAINRGRNDPSIIMWSLGNEIQEGATGGGYAAKAKELIQWAKEVDTSKILTIGSNKVKEYVNEHIDIANQLTAAHGASGTNYSNGKSYTDLHKKYPEWALYGSETASAINSRGVYTTKHNGSNGVQNLDPNKQLTSYDKSCVPWGAFASQAWHDVITRDFVAGEYVWTGFDYIGEPTPANGTAGGPQGNWPSPKNSYFGIIDTAGFPKDSYYLYQSQWNDNVHTLHILPTWNENTLMKDRNGKVEVVVYSDAHKVELKLNGRSLGTQTFEKHTTQEGYTYQTVKGKPDTHENLYMTWEVPFEKGTLEAIAYDENDNVISNTKGRSVVKTTGNASALSASADHKTIVADGKDLTYITVDVKDANGNIVPNANNRVKFKVEGDGVLVGVDNGSSPDHDSYKADNRQAYAGKVLAIVQSTKQAGKFTVTASAEGLKDSTVTVNTTAPTGDQNTENHVDSFKMIKNYYVKHGYMPELQNKVEVNYSDGTVKSEKVKWDEITKDQISKEGSFIVSGKTESGAFISVNVTVIDEVVALLNYSTTVQVGQEPLLPSERPAVIKDGTILNASFAVDWQTVDKSLFNKEGIVTINGTSNVLGKELGVTATVRVQKEKVTLGANIASDAHLTQDVPENFQSDNINAIKDGKTEYITVQEGVNINPNVWSNYKNSQTAAQQGNNKNTATIDFRYDTQQRIGEMTVYFFKDSWSARYPEAGKTEIWVDDKTKLVTQEIIGDEKDNVRAYTYKFDPVLATKISLKLTNNAKESAKDPNFRPCTGITEVQIKKAEGSFTTNDTAKLASLNVNGTLLTQKQLDSDVYNTEAIVAKIKPEAADNAALTILPQYNDSIKIIIESEDHVTKKVFEIKLGHKPSIDPEDNQFDIALNDSNITAGSSQGRSGNEGPKSFAIDKNNDKSYKQETFWHSAWSGTTTDKLWFAFHLDQPTSIEALRYYPRPGESNGKILEYEIYASTDSHFKQEDGTSFNAEKWGKPIAKGTWNQSTRDWKIVQFDKPIKASNICLKAVHTDGTSNSNKDKYISASTISLRKEKPKTNLSSANVTLNPEKVIVPYLDKNNLPMPDVKVVLNGKTLEYGIDYKISYKDNDKFGQAKVIVEGIMNYSGQIEKEFTIEKTPLKVETIVIKNQPNKTIYQEGETFDPKGLVISVIYNDQTSKDIAYNENNAKEFSFIPSMSDKLSINNDKVTVTYNGKSAIIDITVKKTENVTLTFNIDGKTTNVTIEKGKTINDKLPIAPAKAGYHFVGWNTKADGTGTEITKDTVILDSMTIYAVYEKNTVIPANPDSNTDKVPTGDKTAIAGVTILLIGSLAGIIWFYSKKSKKQDK